MIIFAFFCRLRHSIPIILCERSDIYSNIVSIATCYDFNFSLLRAFIKEPVNIVFGPISNHKYLVIKERECPKEYNYSYVLAERLVYYRSMLNSMKNEHSLVIFPILVLIFIVIMIFHTKSDRILTNDSVSHKIRICEKTNHKTLNRIHINKNNGEIALHRFFTITFGNCYDLSMKWMNNVLQTPFDYEYSVDDVVLTIDESEDQIPVYVTCKYRDNVELKMKSEIGEFDMSLKYLGCNDFDTGYYSYSQIFLVFLNLYANFLSDGFEISDFFDTFVQAIHLDGLYFASQTNTTKVVHYCLNPTVYNMDSLIESIIKPMKEKPFESPQFLTMKEWRMGIGSLLFGDTRYFLIAIRKNSLHVIRSVEKDLVSITFFFISAIFSHLSDCHISDTLSRFEVIAGLSDSFRFALERAAQIDLKYYCGKEDNMINVIISINSQPITANGHFLNNGNNLDSRLLSKHNPIYQFAFVQNIYMFLGDFSFLTNRFPSSIGFENANFTLSRFIDTNTLNSAMQKTNTIIILPNEKGKLHNYFLHRFRSPTTSIVGYLSKLPTSIEVDQNVFAVHESIMFGSWTILSDNLKVVCVFVDDNIFTDDILGEIQSIDFLIHHCIEDDKESLISTINLIRYGQRSSISLEILFEFPHKKEEFYLVNIEKNSLCSFCITLVREKHQKIITEEVLSTDQEILRIQKFWNLTLLNLEDSYQKRVTLTTNQMLGSICLNWSNFKQNLIEVHRNSIQNQINDYISKGIPFNYIFPIGYQNPEWFLCKSFFSTKLNSKLAVLINITNQKNNLQNTQSNIQKMFDAKHVLEYAPKNLNFLYEQIIKMMSEIKNLIHDREMSNVLAETESSLAIAMKKIIE